MVGLLRAYGKLPEKFRRQFPLKLVGGWGWKSDEVREMLSRNPWKDSVQYLGFVEDAELASLLSRARVMIYPSHYEGFGLPPLEAMACGTPVITTDKGALGEVVGYAAKIVDPNDEAAMASAIREVVEDSALAEDLRQRGLNRVKEFSWMKTAEQTLGMYQMLGGQG